MSGGLGITELGRAPLRPPETVMTLARMGAAFPTRLSFMRQLIRRMIRDGWTFDRPVFRLDDDGYGVTVHRADAGGRTYSLIAYSHALPAEMRTDRVIAEAWDATFVLFDGTPGEADIARLAVEVPKQEAGRFRPSELVLSRANKSLRLFTHIVDALAEGRQPSQELLAAVGYLMRTTAVYGNGKFGIADRARYAERPELSAPFQAEMLAVYLIRCFTIDLVEHLAAARGGATAVRLDPDIRRMIGIGNSTGLGMAPFLVSHPILIHQWMTAREGALAAVRGPRRIEPEPYRRFRSLLRRARQHVEEWDVADTRQAARIAQLKQDMSTLEHRTREAGWHWAELLDWAEATLDLEAQEMLVSLALEPYPDLVDPFAARMSTDERETLDPAMSLADLHTIIEERYDWALALDLDDPASLARFWYVSEEKAEPRLGERYSEPGAEKEMPHAIARDVQALSKAVRTYSDGDGTTAAFLGDFPEFRHIVRRVQTVGRYAYAEIRGNLVGRDCLPIDLLRCKLAFFGASKFDPKSDRWTRITLYQGAPFPDEWSHSAGDDWSFPVFRKSRTEGPAPPQTSGPEPGRVETVETGSVGPAIRSERKEAIR